MTTRERVMAIFEHRPVDRLPWLANMDHWYNVNKKKGALPERYREWKLWDIQKDLGSGIWQRCGVTRGVENPTIRRTSTTEDGLLRVVVETPAGTLTEAFRVSTDYASTQFRVEWMVKGREDLPAALYLIEAGRTEPAYEGFAEVDREVGPDGIALSGACSDPVVSARHFLGIEQFSYLLADAPEDMDRLIAALTRQAVEQTKVAAAGPARIYQCGGNMEAQVVSPRLFERYAQPFFEQVTDILHAHGKLAQYHFDGFLKPLAPWIGRTGLDIVEGFTPLPQGDMTLAELLEVTPPELALQGAVPSCVLCEGFPEKEFERLVADAIELGKKSGRLVLGLGDNTPPDAIVARVGRIGEMVEADGWVGR